MYRLEHFDLSPSHAIDTSRSLPFSVFVRAVVTLGQLLKVMNENHALNFCVNKLKEHPATTPPLPSCFHVNSH